jgi:hypothetical protein
VSARPNVDALQQLFAEWSHTGGRLPAWEFLTSLGCLAVNGVTAEELGRAAAASDVRAALFRLATGGPGGAPEARTGSGAAPARVWRPLSREPTFPQASAK